MKHLFQKGYTPWNKGKKMPLDWVSIETRRKIGKAHKGKKVIFTEEAKKKMSLAKKGKMPKNLSYLHSMPYTEERKRKIGLAHKGLKHTEETKKRISEAKRSPLTPLHKAIRMCYKSRQWRNDIFRRDNYTCVLCGLKGNEIHADHIKKFSLIVKNIKTIEEALNCKDLWDIQNGRTLCVKCHSQTDTWGNKFKDRS